MVRRCPSDCVPLAPPESDRLQERPDRFRVRTFAPQCGRARARRRAPSTFEDAAAGRARPHGQQHSDKSALSIFS
eukprot:905610-Alexandrium_andersonii.AAC.1